MAAQKCLAEGWLQPVPGAAGRSGVGAQLYVLSEAGWRRLQQEAQPRQVLEDFLRVVEKRTAAVTEWIAAAQQLQAELQALRDSLRRWRDSAMRSATPQVGTAGTAAASAHYGPPLPVDGPPLSETILQVLSECSRQGGADCPLPELYQAVQRQRPLSVGQFHDALRQLYAEQAIRLHPWTGPLYALPEPVYALLIGHGVAYYASPVPRHNPPASATPAAAPTGPLFALTESRP